MVKAKAHKRRDMYTRQMGDAVQAGNSDAVGKAYKLRDDFVKRVRRQNRINDQDDEELRLSGRMSKAAKVTLRNINKVEAKRARKLREELPMILQRGAKLHNENNFAFVNKILSNLI
jgi:hypothetical protein